MLEAQKQLQEKKLLFDSLMTKLSNLTCSFPFAHKIIINPEREKKTGKRVCKAMKIAKAVAL